MAGDKNKAERVDALPVLLAGRLYYKKQSTNELSSPITYLPTYLLMYLPISPASLAMLVAFKLLKLPRLGNVVNSNDQCLRRLARQCMSRLSQ